MEQLFPSDANKKILLTADHSRLYSHLFHNERFLRSSLLCSNYECGLSCTLYNGALYYAYINKEHSLLLRCVGESSLHFRLDGTEATAYHAPKLVVFGGFLLLLYFECTDGMYRLKLRAPFADLPQPAFPDEVPASFPELPSLHLQTTAHYLYLFLSIDTSSFLFRYTSAFVPEILGSEKELLTRSRIPWETELQAMNTLLAEKEAKLHAQETLLAKKDTGLQAAEALLVEKDTVLRAAEALLSEKDTDLSDTKSRLKQSEENLYRVRNQLAECETARREALQNLAQTAGLLERAKAQYEELMQVALQYKEEAAKWYGKFTDRH